MRRRVMAFGHELRRTGSAAGTGTQFTSFTSTEVQILIPEELWEYVKNVHEPRALRTHTLVAQGRIH